MNDWGDTWAAKRIKQLEGEAARLREAVRGGAALARERNEAVERLTWVIKGAHGALTDAGTVVVPGVLDGDIGAAIRQVTCERDEARAEVERLRAGVARLANLNIKLGDDADKAEAEVERLRAGIEDNAARWSEMARALTAKAERAEAALAEWRKHDSAPDCVACAVLDAATCGTLAGEGPRLSTPEEALRVMGQGQPLVKMREIKP